MKIAIFSEYYHPDHGGVQMRAKGLAEEFVRLGHEVTVFTIGYAPELAEHEVINGVVVRRRPSPCYAKPRIRLLRRDLIGMIDYALWCRKEARAGFDILIYHEWPVLHAMLAPAEVRTRAAMDWVEFREGRLFGFIQRYVPRLFRFNTCVSDGVAARFTTLSGKCFYSLLSGITLSEFRRAPEREGLIYVGRLHLHKNLSFLIACFEALCARGWREPLTFVGGGQEEEALLRLREASPWKDLIFFAGSVTDEEKITQLSRAKAMVLVSMREGFPVTIAEAMASGVPVITAEYPENGAVSVVNQFGCGVVTKPTVAGVADGIEAVLKDRERYAAASLKGAEALDWNQLAQSLLAHMGASRQAHVAGAALRTEAAHPC